MVPGTHDSRLSPILCYLLVVIIIGLIRGSRLLILLQQQILDPISMLTPLGHILLFFLLFRLNALLGLSSYRLILIVCDHCARAPRAYAEVAPLTI